MKSISNYIVEALIKKDTKIGREANWTIQKAEDGDIITILGTYWDDEVFIGIFKEIDAVGIRTYGYYFSKDGHFEECRDNSYFNIDSTCWLSTEDEKQTLFNVMKKSGYKWNSIKKELKKI